MEKKAQEATHNRKLADEEIVSAEKMIELAKKMDANVAKAEAKLTEATAAFSKKEFKSALELAQESKKIAIKAQEDHVNLVIESTKNLVKLAQDMGVDTPDLDEVLANAESDLKEGKYEEALKLAEKGWEDMDKLLNEQVSKAFTKVQSMIVLAKKVGQDISEVEGLLDKAREFTDKNDYEKSLKFINESMRLTGKIAKEEVSKLIENAMVLLELGKGMEADVTTAEGFYNDAKGALDENNFEKAIELANKSTKEMEKILEKQGKDLIRQCEETVKEAKNINAEVEKGALLLNKAKESLKSKNFEEVFDYSTQVKEEVENAQFQCVLKTISLSRPKFITAKNIGADLSEPMKYLDMSRGALKEKKFAEALELARKGEHSVNKLISNYEGAKEELQLITQSLARASKLGVDTTSLSDMMKGAKAAFDSKDYKRAMNLISQCRETVEQAMRDKTVEIVKGLEGFLSIGEKTGSDIKSAKVFLDQASAAINENDYERAMDLANRSREAAGEALKMGITKEIKVFGDIINAIEEGEEKSKFVKALTSAKRGLENRNYQEAYEFIIEGKNIVEGYIKASIEDAEVSITSLQEMQGDTTKYEEMHSKVKTLYEEKEYSEALIFSRKIMQDVNAQQKKIVTDLASSINENIKQVKNVGMDISEQNTRLAAAKEAIEKKLFKKAYLIMTQSKEETISYLEEHQGLSKAINEVKARIDEAMGSGVDMSEPMKKLDMAEKALKAGNFNVVSGMIEECKIGIEKLTTAHSIKEKISLSKECIDIAKSLDIDTSDAELQLKKTVIYLNNGQFDNALSSAQKTAEKAEGLCNTKISDMLTTAYSMIIEAKKIGLDVLTVEVLYQKAEEALELKRFEKAARYAAQSLDEIEEIRDESQRTANIIHLAGNYIQEAENIKADVTEAKKLLEKAFSELKNNEYISSIELGKKCIRLAKKAKEQKVTESISLFQSIIDKSKSEGMEVSKAERVLDEAKIALEDEDYKEALRLAMLSESEVEKVDLQKKMAAEIIAVTAAKLKEAEKKGIHAESVRTLLINAATALKNNEYIKALEYAMESGLELSENTEEYERATTTLHAASARINESADIGVDIKKAKEHLETAREAFSQKKYATATKFAKETIREAKRSYVEHLSKPLSSCETLIKTATGLGVNVTRANNMLSEARAALEEESYSQVAFFTENCKRQVEREIARNLFEKLSKARAQLAKAQKKGKDVTEVMVLLESGETSLESKNYLDAAGYFQKFMDNVGSLGIEVPKIEVEPSEEELEEDLKEDKEAVEEELFEEEIIEEEIELEDFISDLENRIKRVGKSGINTKAAEKLLKEAKKFMENDPDKAIEFGRQADEELEAELESLSPAITLKIDLSNVKEKNKWYEIPLILTNDGKSVAKDVSLSGKGKDFEFEGLEPIKILKAKEKKEIPLKIRATNEGELKFDIEVTFSRIFNGKTGAAQISEEIKIGKKAGKKSTFKKYKTEATVKCYACNGKIKPGLMVIECGCGNTYHEACGDRLGKCPMCGTDFKKKSSKKKLALKVGT
ncbi:MAG: hypothetical protein JSV09_10750 [Thermoplasmata archaeon]|nr:MAG: hypothetical protein JSV09_10750 [Thermoplasmata archaeon]